jgi:hypothetical protein
MLVAREKDGTVGALGFTDTRAQLGKVIVGVHDQALGGTASGFIEQAFVHRDPATSEVIVLTDLFPSHSVHFGSPIPRFRMHLGAMTPHWSNLSSQSFLGPAVLSRGPETGRELCSGDRVCLYRGGVGSCCTWGASFTC